MSDTWGMRRESPKNQLGAGLGFLLERGEGGWFTHIAGEPASLPQWEGIATLFVKDNSNQVPPRVQAQGSLNDFFLTLIKNDTQKNSFTPQIVIYYVQGIIPESSVE